MDLLRDPDHCGGCDDGSGSNACADGEVCTDGVCTPTCGGATPTWCGDACVNTDTDRNHCGACAAACPDGEVCSSGACALSCQAGLTDCSGSCVDLQTDRSNCGACETECPDGEVCSSGACALSCQAGLTDCSGSCVNTDTDRNHCGACGTACLDGEVCSVGVCQPNCRNDMILCDGTCILPDLAAAFCDDANPCTEDTCVDGSVCSNDPAPMEGLSCNPDPCYSNYTCSSGVCSGTTTDLDGDAVPDLCDNCPFVANPDQEDTDGVLAIPIPYAPEDSTGGTPVSDLDSIDIGFPFTMFGTSYASLTVHDGALISLGGTPICADRRYLPVMPCTETDRGARELIAAAWIMDWAPPGNATMSYVRRGTAPARRLIVHFQDMEFEVQVILYEGSDAIEIHTITQYEGGYTYTRGVAHNDDTAPLAAYLPGEHSQLFSVVASSARYFTGLVPDGVGDACANRVAVHNPGCADICNPEP